MRAGCPCFLSTAADAVAPTAALGTTTFRNFKFMIWLLIKYPKPDFP